MNQLFRAREVIILVVCLSLTHILLKLGNLVQTLFRDQGPNSFNQIEMFSAIALTLFELREVLNQLLHVVDGSEFGSRLFLLQIGLHVILDLLSDFSVVFKHNFLKELVVVLADHNLWLVKILIEQLYSVVFDC